MDKLKLGLNLIVLRYSNKNINKNFVVGKAPAVNNDKNKYFCFRLHLKSIKKIVKIL